jgi:hypothetical protein
MKYDDVQISGIGELLEVLSAQVPDNEPVWFRGHADATWKLDCTLARNGGMDNELPLIRRFKQNALPVTSRTVVWLFLKQFRFECVPVFHGLQGRLAA